MTGLHPRGAANAPRATARTATTTVRGTRIGYGADGKGPLVVRTHGMTQSGRTDRDLDLIDWRRLTEAGFRVVSYDARGHGSSDGTTDPDDYTWISLAEDLLALIDQLSPREPVRAVGVSMGTGTVLTAMTMAPERFAAVALGAPPIYPAPRPLPCSTSPH